jgi:hypothetical protein
MTQHLDAGSWSWVVNLVTLRFKNFLNDLSLCLTTLRRYGKPLNFYIMWIGMLRIKLTCFRYCTRRMLSAWLPRFAHLSGFNVVVFLKVPRGLC